ncbi:MAG: tetratricopeptide repeat protein [Planctomycetota bacterium]|jgi:tetratricopeptide (TPR) repeat protein
MRYLTAFIIPALLLLTFIPAVAQEPSGDGGAEKAPSIEWKESWAGISKDRADLVILFMLDPAPGARDVEMTEKLWNDPDVVSCVVNNFQALRIECVNPKEHPLAVELEINKFPSVLVLDLEKTIIYRQEGLSSPGQFLTILKNCLSAFELEKEANSDADKMYGLAKIYIDLKRTGDAIRLLEKVCELDPENKNGLKVRALFLLGGLEIADKKYDSAAKRFEEVLKLDPDNKSGYRDDIALQMALIESYNNEYGKAAEKLEKFIKDYPDSNLVPEAYFHLGYCHYLLKDKDKAEETFKELAEKFADTDQGKQAEKMLRLIKQVREAEKRRNAPRRG